MHFTEEHKEDKKGSTQEGSSLFIASMGLTLLVIFFVTDSFTSQFQSKLYKKHTQLTQTRMMVAGNIVGLFVSTCSCIARWHSVSASLQQVVADKAIMLRIGGLGICGAMGQFCIYYAIRVLGPLSFQWIMTSRQLLSVLISLVWFGHGVSVVKVVCILTVFAIMSSRQLAKFA